MTIAAHWPRPVDILRYYGRSLDAINSLEREALASMVLSPADLPPSVSALRFASEADVLETSQRLRAELNHEVVLMLVAAFEAPLQVDFQRRIARKQRDKVSKQFRKLWYARTHRHRVHEWITIEDILDVWKNVSGKQEVIGAFKQLVMFRHWLAHGRYWVQKSGLQDVDPYDAWERGRALFDGLPSFGPLPSL